MSQSRVGRPARRSRGLLAGAACAIAVAGVLAAAGLAAAATSPWSVQQVPPVDTATPNVQFSDVSCPTASTCMAVGHYVGTDGIERTFSERWDQKHGGWHVVLPANPAHTQSSGLEAVACASASSCQAIGSTGNGNGTLIAESWNGRSWRTVSIQASSGFFAPAMSCGSASSCFAVGSKSAKGGVEQALTERWNGHRWSLLTPRRPRKFTDLTGVSCPGPRNCYAVGSSSAGNLTTSRVLVEHWNGSRWSTVSVARPAGAASLSAVSCPTGTSCTAVGDLGGNGGTRMLVLDLSKGKWSESLPAVPKAVAGGTSSMYAVSCSAPRVCTALMSYVDQGEELTWATAGRGAKGGFTVTIPATDVATDSAANVSCHKGGCTVVGGLDTNSGRGGSDGTGTTLALRGSGSHFTRQTTPNPAGTVDADLASLSCVPSGFCAAATESGQTQVVQSGDPEVMVRMTAHSPWRVAKNAGSGFLASISCTSATFCLALGSPAGAEKWDGTSWSELSAPAPFDPAAGGLEAVSCVSSSACMAVGSTKTHAGLTSKALAAFWNGTSWSTLTPIRPAGARWSRLAGVSCTSATHCVAAGYYPPATGSPRALVETWNGSSWTKESPNMRVNFPDHVGVSCATRSACMVTWGALGEDLAQWWNGTKWTATVFAGPKPRSQERDIAGVSCMSATSCTAAGSFAYSTGSGPLVETWDGSKWTVTGAPNPAIGIGFFNGVSCTGVRCTAVGGIQRIENVPFAEVRG
ncbi:MAG: hypothetical protein ACRDRJ_14980 [Streptosporangiaceae bacterium]